MPEEGGGGEGQTKVRWAMTSSAWVLCDRSRAGMEFTRKILRNAPCKKKGKREREREVIVLYSRVKGTMKEWNAFWSRKFSFII